MRGDREDMKRLKHLLLIIAVMCLLLLPVVSANAVTVRDSGKCGNNVKWSFLTDGTLTISGYGAIKDYIRGGPWYDYALHIEKIVIEKGITIIGEAAFCECPLVTEITIPNTVKCIKAYAFAECEGLNNISIPNSVTSIGYGAFSGCWNLKKLTLSNSLTTIGDWAFYYCVKLNNITMPLSVKSVGEDAFYLCKSLKSVYYVGNKADRDKISIGTDNNELKNAVWHYNTTYSLYSQKLKNLKVVHAAHNSLRLSWTKITTASGYEIYRAATKNGSYKLIKTVTSGDTTCFVNSGLTTGKAYYYKIRAYQVVNSKKVYGDFTSVVGAKVTLPAPKISSVTNTKTKKAVVKWAKVTGASGYEIYRSTSKNGTYSKVKTITSGSTTSFTNSSLTKNTTYYYKVRAYKTVNGAKVYSAFSTIKGAKVTK